MRTVDAHLLEDKMDEAVTHYMNSHNPNEPVHIDSNGIPMTVQDDGAGRVTIMHQQTYTTQMCRQVSVTEQVGDGPWGEELLEGPIAAIVAHLQNSRHHPTTHHKVSQVRTDAVDTSVILDSTMRFNGQSLDHHSEPIVVQLPPMQSLPPLQDMKRCDTDWFTDNNKKDDQGVVECGRVETGKQPSRKSLPHKKRISRKLKRPHGNTTPHQDQVVVINCGVTVSGTEHEQILPDNYVAVSHNTHIPHQVRPVLVCQECGEYYGEEQLKFYQHLKGHYEPHHTIIIENPVPDLPIDKMSTNCIVDNVATLPDSIVELSLENTVPKTLYQPIEKHILYSTSDKTLSYNSNKVEYSMANMVPPGGTVEAEKVFRKQRHDVHGRETHHNTKLEDMGEFSEPEDLMAGIQVCVPEPYEAPILPHLTVDSGTVRQEPVRHWYRGQGGSTTSACDAYCGVYAREHDTQYKLLKEEVLQRILDTEVSDNANFADNMMPEHEVNDHEQDDHNHDQPDQNHAHDDHGQSHNDHTHNDHGHALNDHNHGINDHSNGHNESNSHESHIPNEHHIQNETESLRHNEHSQNSQEHNDNDQELDESHLTESHSEQWQLHTLHGTDQIEPAPDHNEHVQENNESNQELEDRPLEYQISGGRLRPKRYICTKCDRSFVHRNSLIYHLLSHSGKQHKCRDCDKAFFTQGALKIHVRTHNNVRPYKCEVCGREFRQWSDLKYHRNSLHSDKKNFKCEHCGKEFARKYSLSLHIKVHTGEKNFKCEHCNKSFRCSSYKIAHMRTHTGDRPYKCEECLKGFRSTFDLRRHFAIHEKHRNRFLLETKLKLDNTQKPATIDTQKHTPIDTQKLSTTDTQKRITIGTQKLATVDTHKPTPIDTHKLTTIDTQDGKVQFESEQIEIIPQYDLVEDEPPQKKSKQVALASTTRQAALMKKPSKAKKSKKSGAPNVTVQSRDGIFKSNDDIIYSGDVYNNKAEYTKPKHVYDKIPMFKEEHNQTRELAILRPLGSHRVENAVEKLPYRTENTDGKMQVFTNVEKGMPSQVLGDIRHLEREVAREVRHDMPEGESGFIERLTAMYSISTG